MSVYLPARFPDRNRDHHDSRHRSREHNDGRRESWIEVDLPPCPVHPIAPPPLLSRALGAEPRFTGRNGDDLIVLLDDEATVLGVRPDLELLGLLPAETITVTAQSEDPDHDFVGRVFVLRAGDRSMPANHPVLRCLGPFWRSRMHPASLLRDRAGGVEPSMDLRYVPFHVETMGITVDYLRGSILEPGQGPSAG